MPTSFFLSVLVTIRKGKRITFLNNVSQRYFL